MKRFFLAVMLIILAIAAGAQTYPYTPMTSFGYQYKRLAADSGLSFPTGCGAPSLRNSMTSHAAFYHDSCANETWIYDPKVADWTKIGSGNTFDTSILRGVYMDTAFQIDDSTTRYCKGGTCWDVSIHAGSTFDTSTLRGVYVDTVFSINDTTFTVCRAGDCWNIVTHPGAIVSDTTIYVSGDTVIINNTVINKSIKIPLRDTASYPNHQNRRLTFAPLDSNFYGDNGNAWVCLSCVTGMIQAGTNITIGGNGTIYSPYIINASANTINANVGTGFRILKPASQELKTLFNSYGLNWDSTTNTNGLTPTIDSFAYSTRSWRQKGLDSLGLLISGISTKFGKFGQDATAAEARAFNSNGFDFQIYGAVNFLLTANNFMTLQAINTASYGSLDSTKLLGSNDIEIASVAIHSRATTSNVWGYTTAHTLTANTGGIFEANNAFSAAVTNKPMLIDTVSGLYSHGLINLTTHVTNTLPIGNGGTNITTYTTGDILWASATNTLSKLAHGTTAQTLKWNGSALVWTDTTASGGAFYAFASGGTATASNNFTFNTADWNNWNGTATATGPNPSMFKMVSNLTGVNVTYATGGTATDSNQVSGLMVKDSITAGANSQDLNSVYLRGKLATNSKTGIVKSILRISTEDASDAVHIALQRNAQPLNTSTITLDGSSNLVFASANGSSSFSGGTVTAGTFVGAYKGVATFDNSNLAANAQDVQSSTTTQLLYGSGATTTWNRVIMRGSVATTQITGLATSAFSNVLIGSAAFATANTAGAVPLGASLVVNPIASINFNGGAGTLVNTANAYFNGAATTTVSGLNYTLWSDGTGINRLNGGFMLSYIAKTANYTATTADYVIDLTTNTDTVTLPTAVGKQGIVYTIKVTANTTGRVITTSSQTIDGVTSYDLTAQYKFVSVMSNNANWIIINKNGFGWLFILLFAPTFFIKRRQFYKSE